MTQKGFVVIIPLIILVVLIGAGATAYVVRENKKTSERQGAFQNSANHAQENTIEEKLSEIERQLAMARGSGGMTPEKYNELKRELDELEGKVPYERIEAAKAILAAIPQGGENVKKVTQTPIAPPKQISTAPAPQQKQEVPPQAPQPQPQAPAPPKPSCTSNPNPVFTNMLADPGMITNIIPPPTNRNVGWHLTTHSYVDTRAESPAPLYAPVDMELIDGAHYPGGPYYLDFRVSCEVTIRIAHVTNPAQKIKDALPQEPVNTEMEVIPPIAVKAGELIAYSGGPPHTLNNGFDFGAYHAAKPNRYASSSDPKVVQSRIYTTAVCPYDFFTPELRAKYREKFNLQVHGALYFDGPSFCE